MLALLIAVKPALALSYLKLFLRQTHHDRFCAAHLYIRHCGTGTLKSLSAHMWKEDFALLLVATGRAAAYNQSVNPIATILDTAPAPSNPLDIACMSQAPAFSKDM